MDTFDLAKTIDEIRCFPDKINKRIPITSLFLVIENRLFDLLAKPWVEDVTFDVEALLFLLDSDVLEMEPQNHVLHLWPALWLQWFPVKRKYCRYIKFCLIGSFDPYVS